MRKFIKIAGSLLVLLVIIAAFAADYFYGEAVRRGTEVELHREEEAVPVFLDERNEEIVEEAEQWYEEQEFETVAITSHDGLKLEADFLEHEESDGKAVILAHGFRSERVDMGDFVQFYYEKGFDVLMPDSRGHGGSEGNYVGYGWHDRLDLVQWAELLAGEKESGDIFLHGSSMGAAAVLMASGEELPAEVKGIVADSGYTSAEDILTYQLEHLYGIPSFPVLDITSFVTNIRVGFYFGEASAVDQVANNTRPLFIVHGEGDELVPAWMSEVLYEAAGGEKTLWTVPFAGHVESYTVATTEYQERLAEFLESSMED
ncbi:alpha/beta hydrolase [Evansella sp. LMS18]|uniref:alpha/beta hydrolase n=1 Tax=Evansella sp. LMS18 TaxID=2924033 RepID=UPI0020D06CD1|nr:alpha/beta hydrolase [Evansella sp. LMS18]UTR12642.1 alpha/beta hydrolase [Evansella sp. LMS18]